VDLCPLQAKKLKALSAPLKIVVGSEDLLFSPSHCLQLAKKIFPYGVHVDILEGGHFPLLEHLPALLPVVVEWFEKIL